MRFNISLTNKGVSAVFEVFFFTEDSVSVSFTVEKKYLSPNIKKKII